MLCAVPVSVSGRAGDRPAHRCPCPPQPWSPWVAHGRLVVELPARAAGRETRLTRDNQSRLGRSCRLCSDARPICELPVAPVDFRPPLRTTMASRDPQQRPRRPLLAPSLSFAEEAHDIQARVKLLQNSDLRPSSEVRQRQQCRLISHKISVSRIWHRHP